MKIKCLSCNEENEKRSRYCHICGSALPIFDEQSSIFEVEKYVSKRKFGIKILSGFIVTLAIMIFVNQSIFKPSIDKRLVKMTNELNKNCPIILNEDLVLKNVVVMSDKTIQYNYVLVKLKKEEVKIDTLKKYEFPSILESVKSNPQTKIFRDNNVTMNYYYSDKNGVFIVNYVIKPAMYKGGNIN